MNPVLIPPKDAADHFERLNTAMRLAVEEFKVKSEAVWSDEQLGYRVPGRNLKSLWIFMRAMLPELEWTVRHFIPMQGQVFEVEVKAACSFAGVLLTWQRVGVVGVSSMEVLLGLQPYSHQLYPDHSGRVTDPSAKLDQAMTDPNFIHRWVRFRYAPRLERGLRCTESGK